MPVNTREILNIVADLAEERNLKVAVTSSLKGAALTGATTFIGGLLMGPVGLALGGIAGGITAAAVNRESFRSVAEIIHEMSPTQQALLLQRINNVLRDFSVTDLALLLPLLQGNVALQNAVTNSLISFVQKELNYQIAY